MSDLNLAINIAAVDLASSTLKGVGSAIKALFAGDTASAAADAGKALLGIGVAAVGVAAKSVQMAADYQQSLLKIQAYAGMTKEQTDAMSQSLLAMATAVGIGPKELADALYPIISSGYSAADALNMLKLSAETAAASGAKTTVVADGLTTVLKTFDIDASSASYVMDVLNKTVAQGKMEFPALASVIGKLSLSASGANVPFADMNAALATLTTHGFPSVAQASNALGNMFTQIGVKTDAMAKHAKAAKITFDEHAFSSMNLADKIAYLNKVTDGNQGKMLKMLGGSSLALKAFQSLSGGADDYNKTLTSLQNAHGTTAQVFATASQGFNLQMSKAKAAIDVLMIQLGTALLPILGQLLSNVVPVINGFIAWETKTHGIEGAIHTVIGVISNLASAIGNVIGFFQHNQIAMNALIAVLAGVGGAILIFAAMAIPALVAGFIAWAIAAGAAAIATLAATWPFILIGAIIAAVVFGIIEAVQHWGAIVAWLKGVWGAISSWFMSMLHELGAFFVGVWNGIVSGLKAAWNFIVQVVRIGIMVVLAILFAPIILIAALFIWLYQHNTYFKKMIDAIVGFVQFGIGWLQHAWQEAVAWIVAEWNALIKFATDLWELVSKTISDKFTAAIGFVQSIWQKISSFFVNAWNTYIAGPLHTLWTNVSSVFMNAWNTYIAGPLGGIWNSVSKWFTDLGTNAMNSGKNFISMLVSGITSGAGAIWNAVTGIAQNIWKALGFHSPAKEGPGRDADVWMPNLVSMLSQGLIAGVPKIQAAVNLVAKPLAVLGQPATAGTPSPVAAPASSVQSGMVVINVTIANPLRSRRDVQDLADQIHDELSRRQRRSGNMVTWSSGGKQ